MVRGECKENNKLIEYYTHSAKLQFECVKLQFPPPIIAYGTGGAGVNPKWHAFVSRLGGEGALCTPGCHSLDGATKRRFFACATRILTTAHNYNCACPPKHTTHTRVRARTHTQATVEGRSKLAPSITRKTASSEEAGSRFTSQHTHQITHMHAHLCRLLNLLVTRKAQRFFGIADSDSTCNGGSCIKRQR